MWKLDSFPFEVGKLMQFIKECTMSSEERYGHVGLAVGAVGC